MTFSFSNFAWSLLIMIMNLWNILSPPSSSSIPAFSRPDFSAPVFSSAMEEVAEVEELLWQILLHLPVKSLIRFKSVSMKWNRIISDYEFGISHTRRTPHPIPTSLMMLSIQSMILLPLDRDGGHNRPRIIRVPSLGYFGDESTTTADMSLRIITSCNGLLLGHLSSALSQQNDSYFVTNLTTKKFIKFPAPGMVKKNPIVGITLAFDPAKSPHFTVLCVGLIDPNVHFYNVKMEIYSSETGQWRRWEGELINKWYVFQVFARGVLWNNAMHWLCPVGDSFYFSLVDETMKTLPLPAQNDDFNASETIMFMGESTGFLHLLEVEMILVNNPPMIIYQMMENHRGWMVKHRVWINLIGRDFPGNTGELRGTFAESFRDSYCKYSALTLIWAADGESFDVILWIPGHIVSYNSKHDTVRVLLCFEKYTPATDDDRVYEIHHFNDTLSWFPPPN